MEKQKEINQRSFSNFGFSSILLTFVMLCIVTFSALSLLTANADYKLSKKVADKTTAYYQAEEKAYLLLQKIDQDLARAYRKSDTKETYYALATEYITQEKSDTRLTVSSDGTKISFEIFCAENQSLHVGLRINYPHKSNGVFYELTQWQTISSITEAPDTTLHLLGS